MFVYKIIHRVSGFDYLSLRANIFKPRKLLMFNNFILLITSVALFGFAVLVCVVFYQSSAQNTNTSETDRFTSLYNWIGLSLAGLGMSILCVLGMRGAHLVSLELLLFYFWGVTFFVSPLILATVICFDFYVYLSTYFTHNWESAEFYQVRKYFCIDGTADNKCIAPIYGGPDYESLDAWCLTLYNATDCGAIQEKALAEALAFAEDLVIVEGSVGILNCFQICLSIYLCFVILTREVIFQSMNAKVNLLLIQPILACAVVAYVLWILRDLNVPMYWIPPCFLSLTIIQSLQVPVGIFGWRWKSYKMLSLAIFLLSVTLALMAVCGIACLVFAVFVKNVLLIETPRSEAENIACAFELTGCCCCDYDSAERDRCPEWSKTEIISQLSVIMKICGIVSFLCMLYIIGALIVSAVTRNNLKNYKSDYI
jgi:hypothetical protein